MTILPEERPTVEQAEAVAAVLEGVRMVSREKVIRDFEEIGLPSDEVEGHLDDMERTGLISLTREGDHYLTNEYAIMVDIRRMLDEMKETLGSPGSSDEDPTYA